MKLEDAIRESNCDTAEWCSPRAAKILVAMKVKANEYRIVKSVTDPTVVRRLRFNEIVSTDWVPWHNGLANQSKYGIRVPKGRPAIEVQPLPQKKEVR